MKINFLGTWSALIKRNRKNVSFVIDNKILVDAGPHSVYSMLELGMDPRKISIVLISHMHLDHFSGLPELIWFRTLSNCHDKLTIIGPDDIKESTEELLKILKTPENFEINAEYIENKNYDGIEFFKGNHSVENNGYRIEYNGKTIFYSGDTTYSENIIKGAYSSDLLIHEMTFTDEYKELANISKHSTIEDAILAFMNSGAKNLIPVHFTDGTEMAARKLSLKNKNIIFPKKEILLK